MEVIIEIDTFEELKDNCWSGAINTLNDIERAEKEDELIQHLEEMFNMVNLTTINDYLWHDSQSVYEALGLNSNGEIEENFELFEDGAITDEYVDWLHDAVDNYIDTDLYVNNVCVAEISKQENNNVYIELNTDLTDNININNINKEQFKKIQNETLKMKYACSYIDISFGIDTSEYEDWKNQNEMPSISVSITCDGRLMYGDFDDVARMINDMQEIIEEILED